MSRRRLSRRSMLAGGAAALGGGLLAGCDRVASTEQFQNLFDLAERTNLKLQRLLLRADRPAQEYSEADISPWFKPNGSTDPVDPEYKQLVKANFARWQLVVDGLVERPGKFSLAQLRAMPSRTQITRHDCVEGWSCIGRWKGVPLAHLLDQVRPKPEARYVVFHCADTMESGGQSLEGGDDENADDDASTSAQGGATGGQGQSASPVAAKAPRGSKYYESTDLEDARHVQTILAYDMNGQTLPVAHGAPLRLRLERQLGYKMAKYVMRVELIDSFARLGGGKGGYWEDQGYDWYAGI